jgi:hypothetical protein
VRSALKPLSSRPPTYLSPVSAPLSPELPATRPLPEMPSRAARRAAVAVGTVAIAIALTVDAGLATGIVSGSAKTAAAQPATRYTLASGTGTAGGAGCVIDLVPSARLAWRGAEGRLHCL